MPHISETVYEYRQKSNCQHPWYLQTSSYQAEGQGGDEYNYKNIVFPTYYHTILIIWDKSSISGIKWIDSPHDKNEPKHVLP